MTWNTWKRASGFGLHGVGVTLVPAAAAGSVTLATGSSDFVNNSDNNPTTFTGMSFPNPASGRVCVVAIGANKIFDVTGVTIGGVTATLVAGSSQSGNVIAELWAASGGALNSGTTHDVVVSYTFHSAGLDVGLYSYSLTGASGVTPSSTSVFELGFSPQSVSVTVPTGGAAIAVYGQDNILDATWNNATKDAYILIEPAGGAEKSVGFAHTTTVGAVTISLTGAAFTCMAAAAWGP